MLSPTLLSPTPADAPTAPPSASCAGFGSTEWFMPLPPPPPRPSAGGTARSSHLRPQVSTTSASAPNLGSAHACAGSTSAGLSGEFALNSQPAWPPSSRTMVGLVHAPESEILVRIQCQGAINYRGEGQLECAAPSMPASMPGAGREDEVTSGWKFVESRRGPRRSALPAPTFKPAPIPSWLQGRCCRCLPRGHRAGSCRDPIRCSRCLQNGHKARGCRNSWKPLSSIDGSAVPPPPLPRATTAPAQETAPRSGCGCESPAQSPPLLQQPLLQMERHGDASTRPDEEFVIVPATPEMQTESALLSSNAAVAWLEGARQDVSCSQVGTKIAAALGTRPADVDVVRLPRAILREVADAAGPRPSPPWAARLRHRIIIHLDLHEDHSKAADDDDNPPPPDVHEFSWFRGIVDGTVFPGTGVLLRAAQRGARTNVMMTTQTLTTIVGAEGAAVVMVGMTGFVAPYRGALVAVSVMRITSATAIIPRGATAA
ncbi:hypothetical protein D1007_32136 [Hordeum vulgare]|nr:hypothetical protein D1007_32136 [Hordeum vulgare]